MRIAVVSTSYPAREGDPAGHFVQTEVRELERAGHDVHVLTPRPGGAFGWPGVASRVRERPLRSIEAAAWVARAAARVRALAPERGVAHWCVPAAWPIGAATRAGDLEVVSHGADVRLLRAMPPRARASVVRSVLRRASRWRFVSSSLADDLESSLEGDVARALRAVVQIIPPPLGMFDVSAEVERRRSELGARRLYVCAARLVRSKRVDRVIDYVAGERGRGERVLVVLGDGPERARLESVARAWQIDVRFLGTTSRRETLGWIGAADEVVQASRAEGLSTVVREAEELGVPVTYLA